MADINFSLLRDRLLIFVASLLVCGVLLALSYYLIAESRELNRQVGSTARSYKNSTTALFANKALVEKFYGGFKEISDEGFLDKEKRLVWIETLEGTAKRLQLSSLGYQIDPQKKVGSERFAIPANVELFQSTLSFETSLLHEGDLVALIDDLAQVSSGLLVLEHCQISRKNENLLLSKEHNFTSICNLSWYTARYVESVSQDMMDDI